jgi:hypothetical protein
MMLLTMGKNKDSSAQWSGSGGLSEMSGLFKDGEVIMFGIFKSAPSISKGGSHFGSMQVHDDHLDWRRRGHYEKGKSWPSATGGHQPHSGYPFFIQVSEKSDVDMVHIKSELLRSGGAHKPTHNIFFGPGQDD